MNEQTQPRTPARESDGRFALELRTNKAVQRQMRRDAEREARRRQVIEENGGDEDAWMLWA
jgi:hypothetical protein